jgi:hypothetical protein
MSHNNRATAYGRLLKRSARNSPKSGLGLSGENEREGTGLGLARAELQVRDYDLQSKAQPNTLKLISCCGSMQSSDDRSRLHTPSSCRLRSRPSVAMISETFVNVSRIWNPDLRLAIRVSESGASARRLMPRYLHKERREGHASFQVYRSPCRTKHTLPSTGQNELFCPARDRLTLRVPFPEPMASAEQGFLRRLRVPRNSSVWSAHLCSSRVPLSTSLEA